MSEHMIDSNAPHADADADGLAGRVAALFSGLATGLAIAAPATVLAGVDVVVTELKLAGLAWAIAAGARLVARRRVTSTGRHRRRTHPARRAEPLRLAAMSPSARL